MRETTERPRRLSTLDRVLPPLGQRIIKTAVAVFLCLLYYWLRGYRGQDMPTEAGITAIICMQPYVRDSRDYAFTRFAGTLIGAAWGLLFVLIVLLFPGLGSGSSPFTVSWPWGCWPLSTPRCCCAGRTPPVRRPSCTSAW